MNQTKLYRGLSLIFGILLLMVVYFGFGVPTFFKDHAQAAAVTWVGGTTGTWETGSNWSTGVVPTTADLVTISSSTANIVVTLSTGQTANFSMLTIGGDATFTAGLILIGNIGTGTDITISNNGTVTQQNVVLQTISGDFNIASGGLLTHTTNTASHLYEIDMSAANITLDSGGSINADYKGFLKVAASDGNGLGPGKRDLDPDIDASGAAHGGDGGASEVGTTGGTAYCTVSDPVTLGSSGGAARDALISGNGGGLIRLRATSLLGSTIFLSGNISAKGEAGTAVGGYDGGGGAGGGIKIQSYTITGTPTAFSAIGGNGSFNAGGGGGGCVRVEYASSNSIVEGGISVAGGSSSATAGSIGLISIVQTNTAPTVTAISPIQSSASVVTVTTTLADVDVVDVTNLIVEYSLNGSTWVSSTLRNVTQTETGDGVTTSTGNIADIDTDTDTDHSVALSFEWNVEADIPNTDDTTVYVRITPNDNIENGTSVSSTAFAVDTRDPTTPGVLSFSATSTTSFDLSYGATSTDTNFVEYKIFYSTTTPIDIGTASSLTSSTDSNLGSSTYAGASTTTLSSLSVNTRYYINIWAYDTYGRSASSTGELSAYTLANAPSDVSGSASGTESITVTWSVNGNPSGTEFYADIDSGTDCGWIADMTQCTFSGLAENTTYTITIQAKNGDGVVSSASAIQVLTQEAETDGGGGGGSPPPPPPKGEEICEPDTEICEPDPENPSGLIIINDGASYTNLSTVTVSFDIAFTDQYALSETENFDGISFAPIVPSVSYTMSDGDGTRTIYARFLNEYGMYIAHDIIELDTVPPDPPAITYFHTGFIEKTNTVSRPPVFRGTAEPGSNILVVVNDISDTNNGSVAMLASFFPQSPFLYIASAGETYTVTTKQDGKWNMQFYQFFEPGEYQVSFTAVDPAGNESPTVDSTPFTITHEDPCLGADPPSYCENLTDVCQTPNPPDSCFGELPPDELPPDELPPDELPPDEPPDDLPPDDFVDGVPGDGLAESDQSLPGSSFVDIKSSETQTSTEQATTHQTATDTIGNIQQVDEDETSRTGFIVAAIGKTIRTIIDNPRVERANERVVAPAVVTLAVANVVVGVGLPHTIAFFRFLFSQPLMVFRRRRKKWGVVYNAYTKQPIELATIRVLEADSGHILRSQVTDMHGRYFMLLDPGHYRVEVDKPGFADSSQILRGKEEDSVYLNLYHAGDTIDFAEDQSVLDVNIPLDPITEDKASALIVKDYVKQSIHKGVSLVGLGISMVSFVISPTLQIAGLVLVHISLYGIFFTLARRRRRDGVGIIRDATNKDTLKHVVVRIFDAAYNKLVDTAVTDRKGYYATLVGPSTYYVTYEKPGYERKRSDTIDLSSKKTRGLGGVIARDEWLHPTVEPVDGEMGVHQRIVHNGTKQVEERVKKVVKADGTIKEDDIDKLKDIAQYGGKNS